MTDLIYREPVQKLLSEYGQVSSSLIQRRLKVSKEMAEKLIKKFCCRSPKINNFLVQQDKKRLLKKYSAHAISIPYLQRLLGLGYEETFSLLEEWKSIKKESDFFHDKYDDLRRFVKPVKLPKPEKSLSELQQIKRKRIENAIKYLESMGYEVKKN